MIKGIEHMGEEKMMKIEKLTDNGEKVVVILTDGRVLRGTGLGIQPYDDDEENMELFEDEQKNLYYFREYMIKEVEKG